MDLQALQHTLKKQLEQNDWQIKHEELATIPVHTLAVRYYPVRRAAMDILMKMMLIAYEKAAIKQPDVLADILLVEQLFIHDLTNKMLQLAMLTKTETGIIELTKKGQAQKANGIFEEQLDLEIEHLYYSPTHDAYLKGDLEVATELEEFPAPFQYAKEELGALEPQLLIDELTALQPEPAEETQQLFITAIHETESIQLHDVPILQFICYDKKNDAFFAKVYNGFTATWDEALESILLAQERTLWPTKYSE